MKNLAKIGLLVLVLVATSCASRKKTVPPTPATSYEWLTAKLDIDAENNSLSFSELSGQLRMRKDSIVWMSVTGPMGVEVLRAKISNDSVWILNRLEKTYLAEPIDTLSTQFNRPLSLSLVQNLLLDNKEGVPPVDNQTILLKSSSLGNLSVKLRYRNVKLDEETGFPLKITDKMERMHLYLKKKK